MYRDNALSQKRSSRTYMARRIAGPALNNVKITLIAAQMLLLLFIAVIPAATDAASRGSLPQNIATLFVIVGIAPSAAPLHYYFLFDKKGGLLCPCLVRCQGFVKSVVFFSPQTQHHNVVTGVTFV